MAVSCRTARDRALEAWRLTDLEAQVRAAIDVFRHSVVASEIRGVYLYGSAVEAGLKADSDLDLFLVTGRPLDAEEKQRLVDGLMPISSRDSRPPAWRPLEVTAVVQPDVSPWRYPPRMDFLYGEWLREEFLAGRIEPARPNPDLGVLITMVRQRGRALIGPPAAQVLDAVPAADLRRAMVDTIPSLLDDLEADTRNVLLTLARIWTTLATGEIRSKDAAADWVLRHLPDGVRPMLARARDLYRDGGYGVWPDQVAVRELAEALVDGIRTAYGASR
jgi:predicted nucleotidyltransferase